MKLLRSKRWTGFYAAAMTLFTVYVMLDTFVIPRSYAVAETVAQSAASSAGTGETGSFSGALGKAMTKRTGGSGTTTSSSASASASKTASAASGSAAASSGTVYSDGKVTVTMTDYRESDTDIHVADITLSSADELQTALANNTYGKNVTEKTSAMASEHNAVIAINGDYYGAQNAGYVIRNGKLYRDKSSGTATEDLVIYSDGTFEVIKEGEITAAELLSKGAWQVFSFGPGLIENGTVTVDDNTEVARAMKSNPRTAIGQIGKLHYVFVTADGRTGDNDGLSVKELADFIKNTLGCTTAYNLDGGGSSTMYFNGSIVNNPTTNGRTSERSVSDIVYIGKN